jgi:H+/Cl- antiporter ClcA
MIKNKFTFSFFDLDAKQFIAVLAFVVLASVAIGISVAFFLWLLDVVTQLRFQFPAFIFLLPIAGVVIYLLYKWAGKNAASGNNLIIDEIHEPVNAVPGRMAPLILFTTVLTHLVGGSAGREGTAVQMGGGISSVIIKKFKLHGIQKKWLLVAGMSAGFAAVFGTPLAASIFALEVLSIGKTKFKGWIFCLIAAFVAHYSCLACGIHHTVYTVKLAVINQLIPYFHFDLFYLLLAMVGGVLFGLTARLFSFSVHRLKEEAQARIKQPLLIPLIASIFIWGITYALGTYDYLGLGVNADKPGGTSIVAAFSSTHIDFFAWFWKLLLTVITLSMGFKGGEVTPLFFIGATLGNSFAMISGAPIDLFAALGFVAVFAGAANTPLACVVMGIELFGGEYALYLIAACYVAYYFSGHAGIYKSQRVEKRKDAFLLKLK